MTSDAYISFFPIVDASYIAKTLPLNFGYKMQILILNMVSGSSKPMVGFRGTENGGKI